MRNCEETRLCFLCQQEVHKAEFLESLGRCYGCLPCNAKEIEEIKKVRASTKKKKSTGAKAGFQQAKTLDSRSAKGVFNVDH